jgi:hypothetical protein
MVSCADAPAVTDSIAETINTGKHTKNLAVLIFPSYFSDTALPSTMRILPKKKSALMRG